jgi:sugar phosphate isomerase/epimerase
MSFAHLIRCRTISTALGGTVSRPITLVTGQWTDLPLEDLAKQASAWGFDGLELACWGDHFEVDKALEDDAYLRNKRDLLAQYGLRCFAVSNHLVGQCICDNPIDDRHKAILPARIWGEGDPERVRERAAQQMMDTARAARLFGVRVVTGFTGSSIWSKLYFFPPTSQMVIDYDIWTAQRALAAVDRHPQFGFNFDPSHFVHQFVNPVFFIEQFADRIFHVHVKDTRLQLNGHNSILASHLAFGDPHRGWDFASPGRGDVKWDPIIRALNHAGYHGPLSIEWEDSGMDRVAGAREALALVRSQDFAPSTTAFDATFGSR